MKSDLDMSNSSGHNVAHTPDQTCDGYVELTARGLNNTLLSSTKFFNRINALAIFFLHSAKTVILNKLQATISSAANFLKWNHIFRLVGAFHKAFILCAN